VQITSASSISTDDEGFVHLKYAAPAQLGISFIAVGQLLLRQASFTFTKRLFTRISAGMTSTLYCGILN
jgi:hypothetical protein